MLNVVSYIVDFLKSKQIEYIYDETFRVFTTELVELFIVPILSSSQWASYLSRFHPSEADGSTKRIRIWEDQIVSKPEIIQSRLSSIFNNTYRIHARKTVITCLTQLEMDDFLTRNHLNASIKSKYRFGLTLNSELMAVAAFGRSCPIQRGNVKYKSHELIRYCSKLNHTIVGGLSKLINHFIKQATPDDIMTYVDREWSNGQGYTNLGFERIGVTNAQTFWLPPGAFERVYPHQLPDSNPEELIKKGWKQLTNAGNIKLVRLLK